MTPLDQAHAEMVETGEDAARLRFYERLADVFEHDWALGQ